jgi:hypothetical protein
MPSGLPGSPDGIARGQATLPLTGRERGIVLSPVKLWVLAMLAPKRGAARGSGPAASGEFDRACARLPMKWQVGTEEQVH